MLYIVLFVLVLVYTLVKWIILRLAPMVMLPAGLWVIIRIDVQTGALILLGAGIILLASSNGRKSESASWNYKTRGRENPDVDRGRGDGLR